MTPVSVTRGTGPIGLTLPHGCTPLPDDDIDAIRLDLARSTDPSAAAAPWPCDSAETAARRPHLADILTALADLAPTPGGSR